MTLATAILLFSLFPANTKAAWQTTVNPSPQPPAATEPAQSPSSQETQAPAAKPSASDSSSKPQPAAHPPASAKPTQKKTQKKASASGCNANPTTGAADPSQSGTSKTLSQNCPPPKIVVQQGGTSEPSIQLAGGDQDTKKRAATNQMLGSAEANLKKISGIQLTADQQDTASQVRQFVDQSRAALAAGDLERGNTLAWKAQLLSEDLVKPQK
jgi:hypothetical protein